jgi:hypothetical protein
MDQYKLAIAMMAVTDSQWGPHDADGRRRQLTGDALAAASDQSP